MVLLAVSATAVSQNPNRVSRLASPMRVAGSVCDEHEQPITGVELVFTNDPNLRQPRFKTDANGNFDVTTTAPYLLFRKDGFNSVRLPVTPSAALKITLRKASRTLAPCVANLSCYWVDGLRFCVPAIEGIVAEPADSENGHYVRKFRVTSIPGMTVTMRHGGGVMWGFGGPSVSRVWGSKEYSESVYLGDRVGTIDAKGTDSEGKHWRVLGTIAETIEYEEAPPEVAAL